MSEEATTENTDGVHHLRSSGPGLPVAAEQERQAVIHHIDKRLRLWSWQMGLVLEGFEKLNATLAEIEREGARG